MNTDLENKEQQETEEEEKKKKFEFLIDYIPHLAVAAVITIVGLIVFNYNFDVRVAHRVRGFEYQYSVSKEHYEKESFEDRALNYAIIKYFMENLDYNFEGLISNGKKRFTTQAWKDGFEKWMIYLYPLYTTKAKITSFEEAFSSTTSGNRDGYRNKPYTAFLKCNFDILPEDYNPYNLQCVSGTTFLESHQGVEFEYTLNEKAYVSVFLLYLDDLKVFRIANEVSDAGRNFFPQDSSMKFAANDLLRDESIIVTVATPKPLKIDTIFSEHGADTIKMYDFYKTLHKQKKFSFYMIPLSRPIGSSKVDPYHLSKNLRPQI